MFDWTPVTDWLLQHGTRILIILLVGVSLRFALNRFLPSLVRRLLVTTKGESAQEIRKRADTLVSVFSGVGRVVIITVVILMILSELDIPIGPVLAGFGIAGIAVGFGAQYLIRDLIAGVFVLMENQYRVGDVARVAEHGGGSHSEEDGAP